MSENVSIRDLRNHTKRVIDSLEDGTELVLTRNGRPIAKLVPLVERTWGARMMEILDATEQYDSGLTDWLEEERRRAAEQPDDPWHQDRREDDNPRRGATG